MSKFGTINALVQNLKTFQKLLPYLKSALSNGLMEKRRKKAKMPKFRTKNSLFGYFRAKIAKIYCHI